MKTRWVVRDGLRLRVGSKQWKWWRKHRRALNGQPPLKNPPAHTDIEQAKQVVTWAHWGVLHRASFVYTESAQRSEMFHRTPGALTGRIYADCSQFVASILHWVGVKTVTDTDFTGTLLQKGKPLGAPRAGCVVIWGPGTGTHAAFITEKNGTNDWWTIGFGHQGAPDRVALSAMNTYFAKAGHPGTRFLDFLAG